MSKKILSIALAVVMLCSVFAFSVSAATDTTTFPATNQGGYRVVSDAYVGMPAGETVTVKVYFVLPAGTDYDSFRMNWNGNTVLAFTDAFDYVVGSRVWGESYSYMLDTATLNASAYAAASKQFNAADKAMGWTKAIMVQRKGQTGIEYGTTVGHPVDPACELYSVQFTTTRALTATDTIGMPTGCASKMIAFKPQSSSANYTAANTILTEATAYADVAKVNDTATAKMRPGAAAGTVDLGITGTVKDISFNPGKTAVLNGAGEVAGYKAANLANVGVQARVNGGTIQTAEGTCVYATTDGFNYRAAITGITADGLGAQIEVRTYIKDVNGNTYYSNWMCIDAEVVHANAVGNGMTGIA